MKIQLSHRVQRIKPSPTLAVTAQAAELKAAGRDIVGLGAGEPDFDTPEHIKQAAKAAIDAGNTKYTPVDGTPQLKDAVRAKFERDNGLRYEANQILVSSGAKQCIYNAVQALLNPGDEAIIPAPYWVSYLDIVLLADAEPVVIQADQSQRFKITPEQLEAALSPRTRLLFLNSPSNPTGVAYTEDELRALGEVLQSYPKVVVLSDDIYEHIQWTEAPFRNIVNAYPDLYERTVVINGVSKAYSMTGWRIGYAAGPADLIQAMKKAQSQSTSNPSSISQAAALAALEGDQGCIRPMLQAFKERHDYVVDALNAIDGVSCLPGDGTFYAFPNVERAIERLDGVYNDVELAGYLLDNAGVALVPGSAFGLPGHMRLSFATGMDQLEKALGKLRTALEGGGAA